VNEDLLKAAEYIDENGWVQGKLLLRVTETNKVAACLQGAIKATTRITTNNDVLRQVEAQDHLKAFLKQKYGLGGRHANVLNPYVNVLNIIPYVNDNILTSAEEASKILREAAEWEEPT